MGVPHFSPLCEKWERWRVRRDLRALPCLAKEARHGAPQFRSLRFGSLRFGSLQFGSLWFGSLQFCLDQFLLPCIANSGRNRPSGPEWRLTAFHAAVRLLISEHVSA